MARVDGKGSGGSFWQSTAAMITAVATLIASLVGLAAFLVGQQVFGAGEDKEWTSPSGAPVVTNPVKINNKDVQWGPTEFRLEYLMRIDFDGDAPIRNGGAADVYLWGGSQVSSSYGIYVWPGKDAPTGTDCATYLATHGTSEYIPIEPGMRLCVRTDEGRTALMFIKQREGEAWLVDGTVWRERK